VSIILKSGRTLERKKRRMRHLRSLGRLLLAVTLIISLVGLTGCGTRTEYLRADSKPYVNEKGDYCMAPGVFAELIEKAECK
jgi:hypothetical protein